MLLAIDSSNLVESLDGKIDDDGMSLMDRLSYSVDEVKEKEDTLFSPVPYDKVNPILNDKRQTSMNWLKDALEAPNSPDLVNELVIMTEKYKYHK